MPTLTPPHTWPGSEVAMIAGLYVWENYKHLPDLPPPITLSERGFQMLLDYLASS